MDLNIRQRTLEQIEITSHKKEHITDFIGKNDSEYITVANCLVVDLDNCR